LIQASQHAEDHRKAAFVVSPIRPDVLEPRETALERCEQDFAPVLVLKTGLKHELVPDQAVGIHVGYGACGL